MTFDIETDGLLDTMSKIHCIAIDDELYDTADGIRCAVERLMNHGGVIVGHNIVGFDIPAIQKIFPWFNRAGEILDTKIWAQLVCPDVLGLTMDIPEWRRSTPPALMSLQSLRAWGYRLGVLKGISPDETWQEYTPEMGKYCLQDVTVTQALYRELAQRWTTSDMALQTEMDIARLIQRQIEFGVCFDTGKAQDLAVQLDDELRGIAAELQQIFPPWQKLEKSFVPKVNSKKYGHVKGQLYHKFCTVEFNPGSNHHLAQMLQEKHAWVPQVFTDKGNPQMDEKVLEDLSKVFPEVSLVVKWRTANKIKTFISGSEGSWLNHVDAVGRIHGNVNSCGAGTRRMTHNSPNLGQVPSARAYLGKECRGLFGPPPGYMQVGVDADQLELRGLAHFLAPYDGGAYVFAACNGSKENQTDIHWRNAKAVGVPRDDMKTIFYAYIYGAGDAELGSNITKGWDMKVNRGVGRKIRRKLERGVPALVKLKENILAARESRGFLYDLQCQMFRLRSSHSAMNELNQRAGAIIMKVGQLIADDFLKGMGFVPGVDYEFMLTVHDEWQFACLPQHANVVAEVAKDAIRMAGEDLKFRCPLSGDASIGHSWADTH